MSTSRSRIVIDSNVLIDFHNANLLNELFALNLDFHTTDMVLAEQQSISEETLLSYGLRVLSLSATQLVEIVALRQEAKRTSIQDLSTYICARDLEIGLLTGDGALRGIAQKYGVEVHGSLWLLDKLVNQGVVDGNQAASALEAMMEMGGRFPEAECRVRIIRWRK